mgnify:FL=1
MGLLEYVVGRESVLNQPNSVFGILFYIVLIAAGKYRASHVVSFPNCRKCFLLIC